MGLSRLDNVKKEIRSVLITSKNGLSLSVFLKSYKGLLGFALPFREFGYTTVQDFLQSIPDVVKVSEDIHDSTWLKAVTDESTAHIEKLVERQKTVKKTKPHEKVVKTYAPLLRPNAARGRPFVPALLRSEILSIVREYVEGISYNCLSSEYLRRFKRSLSMEWLGETQEEMLRRFVLASPEFKLLTKSFTVKICCVETNREKDTVVSHITKERSSPLKTTNTKNQSSKPPIDIEKDIKEVSKGSGISSKVKQNIEKVLKQYPKGVLAVHFPILYQNATGTALDFQELGFISLLELVDALPEIFVRSTTADDTSLHGCLLFHVIYSENISSLGTELKLQNTANFNVPRKCVSGGIASASFEFASSTLPENAQHENIPVYISAAVHPTLFWFQVYTADAISTLRKLERDLEHFYNSYYECYKMDDADILIGATCVIYSKARKQWLRSLITSMPSMDHVHVSFVDYGDWDKVPRSSVYYLMLNFTHPPAQAFKAKLASLKPKQASTWSVKAQQRFSFLSKYAVLMAEVHAVQEDVMSVFLCDSSGINDIHINDVLIQEGLAEISVDSFPQNDAYSQRNNVHTSLKNDHSSNQSEHSLHNNDHSPRQSGLSPHKRDHIPLLNGHSTHENDFSSSKSSYSPQMNGVLPQKTEYSPRQLNASINGHCSPSVAAGTKSPDVQEDTSESRTPSQMLQTPQNSFKGPRRKLLIDDVREDTKMKSIRKIELGDGYKIHIILLKERGYVSGDELSNLFWNSRGADTLANILKFKNALIPMTTISKQEHKSLFEEGERSGIKEFAKYNESGTLFLYTLQNAMKILNCLGHPSRSVRDTLLKEIQEFNPYSAIWRVKLEASEDTTSCDFELDARDINRLCIYDLKSLLNGLQFKKTNLEKNFAKSADIKHKKDAMNIERKISTVMTRIESIQDMCSEYDS